MFGVTMARTAASMRLLGVALTLGLLASAISAQRVHARQPGCQKIEGTSERLACYDAAFPPKAKRSSAQDSQSNNALRGGYKDPLVAEDARMATKLKNICRGC